MLNAERMLSNLDSDFECLNFQVGVNAKLNAPFTFARLDGREITLAMGAEIHVDELRGIASYGNDYFEVDPSDYTISYLN